MSISAFAVNRIGRAENETTQSVQMTDNQKGEAAATRQKSSEAQTKTRQENMKKSDSESKTKDNSEEQKKDSKDADNKGAKENSTEKDAKEDSEKNISEEEKSTKEEKNTEKKSEETTDVSEATTTAAKETTTEAAEKKTEAVTEKTPEGKDSKEATSEEKAEEETQAEDDKNKEIAVTSISKTVAGNLGDKSKYFDFTVTLTGKEGEEYSLPATITGGSDKSGKKENVAISGTTTFKLKHGDTITIENLPAGVSYKVEEATPSDYTMNATGQEGTMDAEAKTAAFTNTKTGDIDTGVYLDNLPYILVFAGVLAIAAVFIVRRRRFED